MEDEDRRQLLWLRKALRLYLKRDALVVIPALGESGTGADEFELDGISGYWTVAYIERGQRNPIATFKNAGDATKFVFWTLTASTPLNFQLDDCSPEPY